MANSAWGIDLGNRALKAVKLVREGDRLRVDDFEIVEHEHILSVAGDNKESMLQTALAGLVQRHDMRGSDVAVGVSGQQSFARFIKLPPVESKKIPEIVRFEAIQQIPFPLDDVEWAYQLFQAPDSPDVEVGIFAMKKELVNRQIAYLTSLNLDVQVVQMMPLAVFNAMHAEQQIVGTTMFMDSGAENTDLIIADGHTVWLRTLPIGGNNFTEQLAKSFKLSFTKAEELKRNAATSKYAKQIFQAMRPVFADLVAEIQRSIGFYASVHRDARIERIVALGGTFQLPGLQKYLQQNLQLPVEKLDGFKVAPPADAKLAADFAESAISLAGAYGLAVQAMGEGKITSSLLPAAIKRARMWREKQKWFAAAAALFVAGTLGVGGLYYATDAAYKGNAPLREQNMATRKMAEDRLARWNEQVARIAGPSDEKSRLIKGLNDYKHLWPLLLNDIISAAPVADLDKPREQRRVVLIDKIQSRYFPDLTGPLAARDMATLANLVTGTGTAAFRGYDPTLGGGPLGPGGPGGPDPDDPYYRSGGGIPGMPGVGPPPGAKRGYIIVIEGFTPNAGGMSFLRDTILQTLRSKSEAAQAQAGMPYYIARADIVSSKPRVTAPTGGGAAPVRPGGGGWMGGPVGGGPMVDTPFDPGGFGGPLAGRGRGPTVDPTVDRMEAFKGESMEKDTSFTIVAIAVVDPGSQDQEGAR